MPASAHDSATNDDLAFTVEEVTNGPDRVTVYVPGDAEVDRMVRWLSIDKSALVDCATMR